MKTRTRELPRFRSERGEADFWARHSPEDFSGEFKPIDQDGGRQSRAVRRASIRILELGGSRSLKPEERRINERLKAAGFRNCRVRLLRTSQGKIGYSANVSAAIPSDGKGRVFETVHRIVCECVGYRRGRPAGVPTHQVKCRIPEGAYRRLVKKARKKRVSPSDLASQFLARQIGA